MSGREETVTIKKLGINGEGIAYLNKKITFVQGALPDETVLVRIIREEPRYMVGQLLEILTPSKKRLKPRCSQQPYCQSCPVMILEYEAQLESKERLAYDTFNKYVPDMMENADFERIDPAPSQYGIRNIVRLPVVRYQDRVTFGIYQRETKYLTLMRDCPMQSKKINTVLKELEEIMNDMHLRSYDELKRKGIRFLTVREFDNGMQLIFVTGNDKLPDRTLEAITKIPGVASVIVTVNTSRKQEFVLQRYENKLGKGQMNQIFMEKNFQISSKADFPVNRVCALRMAKTISQWLDGHVKSLIDVGCGVGLFSLGLNSEIEIFGIDENRINILDATTNARKQERGNSTFEDGDPAALFAAHSKKQRPDVLMMHMDRFTFSDEFVASVLASKIPAVIMECSHVSQLAKQCGLLSEKYEISRVKTFDSHPNGAGFSGMVLLNRMK